jgi:hypothetical protein
MAYTPGTFASGSAAAPGSSVATGSGFGSSNPTYAAGDNAIVVVAVDRDGTIATSGSVADTAGNTYNAVGVHQGTQYTLLVFYGRNMLAGTPVVTCTNNGVSVSGGSCIYVLPVAGLANVVHQAFLGANTSDVAVAADSITTGNLTPTSQPAMLFGFSMKETGAVFTWGAGTGFTALTEPVIFENNLNEALVEHRALSSTTPVPAAWTISSGAVNRNASIGLILTEAGGGGSAQVSARNERTLAQISAFNERAKASVAAINERTIA